MIPGPAALLGAERGPAWPLGLQQRVSALFAGSEHNAAADWLDGARSVLGLSTQSLGTLAAAVSASWDRAAADRLVWTELATLKLALQSDLYEIVQVDPLAALCGGFIRCRLRLVADPIYEAAALVQAWCVRLSGLPMTYGYLSSAELDRFAGIVSRYAADSLRGESQQRRFLRGVARTLQAHVWRHAASFPVPASAPPEDTTAWAVVSWREGQDSLVLPPG